MTAALGSIDSGEKINDLNSSGESVWNYVVPAGVEAVRMAILLGAEIDLKDRCGHGALYWAIHAKNSDVVKTLLDAGASLEAESLPGDCTLLHEAASVGSEHVLAYLLKVASLELIERKDLLGATALNDACASGNLICAKMIQDATKTKRSTSETNSGNQ